MKRIASRLRLRSESGFSLVELVVTCAVMGIVLTGVVNILVSGEKASGATAARVTAQQSVRSTFDRFEYDARCADTATLLNKTGSNGAGVYLHLPTQCAHATGTVTWCVTSGSLVRNTGTTCAATTHLNTFVRSVSSATPFSCYVPSGATLPQVKVVLGVNTTTASSTSKTATDYITMFNATATTACS